MNDNWSRNDEQSAPPRVAFQGARGAFSEEAAVKLFGERVQLVPRPTFESLFAAIDEGRADYALAPIENSLAGAVQRSHDLLLESALCIVREVVIPISHSLIACPGATREGIKTVESHPVALAQCVRFLAAHEHLRAVATEDTAASVAQIMASGDVTRAAVASSRAAQIYGGTVLLEHLEDEPENFTRFLLLASSDEPSAETDKLSLVIKLSRGAGVLRQALETLARKGLDLLRVESRPVKGEPWQYYFFLDLRAALQAGEVDDALAELRSDASMVRVLGLYPSARI